MMAIYICNTTKTLPQISTQRRTDTSGIKPQICILVLMSSQRRIGGVHVMRLYFKKCGIFIICLRINANEVIFDDGKLDYCYSMP